MVFVVVKQPFMGLTAAYHSSAPREMKLDNEQTVFNKKFMTLSGDFVSLIHHRRKTITHTEKAGHVIYFS